MTNWTEEQLAEHYRQLKTPQTVEPPTEEPRLPAPKSRMNKWESAYAQELEMQRRTGYIVWFAFEPLKLRLAESTFYTPDFIVIRSRMDSTGAWSTGWEAHEVKGFWREDARVKIKVAAVMFPYLKFVAVTKKKVRDGGGWKVEEFNG